MNAIKHGMLSNLITDYDKPLFENFQTLLLDDLEPVGFIETLLVERIASYYVRLFRSSKVDSEFMQSRLKPRTTMDFDLGVLQEGYKPTIKIDDLEELDRKCIRYETSIENRLYKALHELERLQRMRKGETIAAPTVVDVAAHVEAHHE